MPATKRLGKATVVFTNPPRFQGFASVVGKKEGNGPLKDDFDLILQDTSFGQKTWEKAESSMQQEALQRALTKANMVSGDIDYVLAGDLLNQCIGSTYGLRSFEIPLLGLFGACSTMAETLVVGSMLIDGGMADNIAAVTSSHFCTAERQFRLPLEYGGQRTPTAQWTVTGSGAAILSAQGTGPYITHAIAGKIIDLGITDTNNMGAAMAPAAADTITQLFIDTCFKPEDFDLILTGDLGKFGQEIVIDFLNKAGYKLSLNYDDCGCLIYDLEVEDVHAGGSGCGCSAVTLCGHVLKKMSKGELNKVLFVATGALMSPTSVAQGESIPGIAHGIIISNSPN